MTWQGGQITDVARCVLAPNPGPMTLDGTNTWILASPGARRCVVIDPGPALPAHLNHVSQTIAASDMTVEVVLLTHGHPDHAEGAAQFAREHSVDVRALDPQMRLGSEGLNQDDVVAVGDLEIRVIETPGHTSDSLCFFTPMDNALITGDTVLGRGTTVVMHPDGRVGDYLASLKKLQGVHEAEIVLPGHGPVVKDPAAVLSYYLKHRSERLAEVSRALLSLSTDVDDVVMAVVERVYADVPKDVWPAAALSVAAQIDYLRNN